MSNLPFAAEKSFRRLLDWLVGRHCLLCGATDCDEALCDACACEMPTTVAETCPRCALPSVGGALCGQCLRRPPAFDRTVAVLEYAFPADRLVHLLKYRRRLAVSSYFSRLLLSRASSFEADLLVPMPVHRERLRERGFNQAVEIARPLARQLGLPVLLDGVRRHRGGPSQAELPWRRRHANVRGAFACDVDLGGKSVLVVDDVMTTGATLNALAEVLKRAGACRVENLVVARTPSPD